MHRLHHLAILILALGAAIGLFVLPAIHAGAVEPAPPTHEDRIDSFTSRFGLDPFVLERRACREAWGCDADSKTDCCGEYCDLTACTKAATSEGLTWGAAYAKCSPHTEKYQTCMRNVQSERKATTANKPPEAPSVQLELTYPVGKSPRVFTEGWVFGARCSITRQPSGKTVDCSGDVAWSGTGSFSPGKGKTSKPRFNLPGPNRITLSVVVDGERHEHNYPVTAVASQLYAKIGDPIFCYDVLFSPDTGPMPVQGHITSGSALVTVDGIHPAARQGDTGVVAASSGTDARIETGDPNVLIEGKPAARQGDRIQCKTSVGAIGVPGVVAEQKLPAPVKITLEASRRRLPGPVEITLKASRPRLPEPVEITLQATRPAAALVEVPPVISLALDEARSKVSTAGLTPVLALGDAAAELEQKPGTVYAAAPGAGERVAPGSPVTLTVYGPRPKKPIPGIAGMTVDAASALLSESKFVAGAPSLGDAAPEGSEPGTVQASVPPAGTLAEIFTAVLPVVFGPRAEEAAPEGPEMRAVPPLAGLTIAAANARLREHNFIPGLPTLGKPAQGDVEPGTVSGSSPGAGVLAKEQTVILPIVWGLRKTGTPDEPDVADARAPREPETDKPPITPEPPQAKRDPESDGQIATLPPGGQPESEETGESGWAGRWKIRAALNNGRLSTILEFVETPDGVFMSVLDGKRKHSRYRADLKGEAVIVKMPYPGVGTMVWKLTRQDRTCRGVMEGHTKTGIGMWRVISCNRL